MSLAPVQDDSGRSARFDPETRAHDHFVCRRCKRIFDVARDGKTSVDLSRLETTGFRVTSHTLAVYGLCPDCASWPPRRGTSE
jgi:Fur family peroxide stress response transcriptional regulator